MFSHTGNTGFRWGVASGYSAWGISGLDYITVYEAIDLPVVMTVFVLISMPHLSGHISNINVRVESKIQRAEKSTKQLNSVNIDPAGERKLQRFGPLSNQQWENTVTHSLRLPLTMNYSIHTWAHYLLHRLWTRKLAGYSRCQMIGTLALTNTSRLVDILSKVKVGSACVREANVELKCVKVTVA